MINTKYFIVPGFAKCGTTWLFDRLAELPDFEMTPHKEIHYFNRNKKYGNSLSSGKKSNYFIIRKNLLKKFGFEGVSFFKKYLKFTSSNDKLYTSLFRDFNKITGDITPIYCTLGKDGVQEMSNLLGDVKIIFILRDPIERDWSQFRFNNLIEDKSLDDFNSEQIISFFKKPLNISKGNYIEAIENFEQSFLKSKILITFYDNLKSNPKVFLEKIVRFLGGDSYNIGNHLNIQKRSHVSRKAEIPPDIYEYLMIKNKTLIKDLSDRFGGHCSDWLHHHYGKGN